MTAQVYSVPSSSKSTPTRNKTGISLLQVKAPPQEAHKTGNSLLK